MPLKGRIEDLRVAQAELINHFEREARTFFDEDEGGIDRALTPQLIAGALRDGDFDLALKYMEEPDPKLRAEIDRALIAAGLGDLVPDAANPKVR